MNIRLGHLNINAGQDARSSMGKGLDASTSFFIRNDAEKMQRKSNIPEAVAPLLRKGGDILGFTEVFGLQQVEEITELLESKGYKTHYTKAFGMWSMPGENLYNVLGIQGNDQVDFQTTLVHNKRKAIGRVISLANFLSLQKGSSESILEHSKNIYKQLAKGVLDGAITSFSVGDLNLSHLHIHSDNPDMHSFFEKHIQESNHIMFGDFNIENLGAFIMKPPFAGKGYKSLEEKFDRTFNFTKGPTSILGFDKPDGIVTNLDRKIITAESIPSLSDHNGLIVDVN